jgi:preprotein translocase SecA subunit
MFNKILKSVFGTKSERDLKKARPTIEAVNRFYLEYHTLSDHDLRYKTEQFRTRLADGENMDELLPEAFAALKELCRRLMGKTWSVCDIDTRWNMVPFDVQLMGAVVLHEGKIAEMATGEGKTLVATMPLYLNGMSGKAAHLVTVNDYLARRDSQWMGKIYEFMGLAVDCIQHDMDTQARKQAYRADITYGTNNEFGFDLLRDNMEKDKERRVQRHHNYAIVDEVDSILIDEARTPLIISGPVTDITDPRSTLSHATYLPRLYERGRRFVDILQMDGPLDRFTIHVKESTAMQEQYSSLRPAVERLAKEQVKLVNGMIADAERMLGAGQEYEAGIRLLAARRGSPKNRKLLKLMEDGDLRKLVERVEADFMREKRLHEIDQELFYSIDEKSNSVDLRERGRLLLERIYKPPAGRRPGRPGGPVDFKVRVERDGKRIDLAPETKRMLDDPEQMDILIERLYSVVLDKVSDDLSGDETEESGEGGAPEEKPDKGLAGGASQSLFVLPRFAEASQVIESNTDEILKDVLVNAAESGSDNGAPKEEITAFIDAWVARQEDVVSGIKAKLIDRLEDDYDDRGSRLHSIAQLLKAFSLFQKDVDYIVRDGTVLIVDQFTGRLMPGRRYSDGLHQALEAKEQVTVERETQTLATITIQNYFRLYDKLAGMTGTAETEASEFWEIYNLDVVVIPTNEPVRRVDYEDVIYLTQREKYIAIIDEIVRMHEMGRPVLVGTVTVEVSEVLSRMLKRKGIEHSVLNAKYHEQEARIVARAGEKGAVTIATNMAGRGTDIKLGEGIVKCELCCYKCSHGDCRTCPKSENTEEACVAEMPCGLHIVGTERHESRRIDRQLRGRSGRQGDPGSSRFYLSLEDDLMRLFGSDRLSGVISRLGIKEGEAIEHSLMTKQIERAQKRVEGNHFAVRKHLLEYDDVMNKQRGVIYAKRQKAVESTDISGDIKAYIHSVLDDRVTAHLPAGGDPEDWDLGGLRQALRKIFGDFIEIPEPFDYTDHETLRLDLIAAADEAYHRLLQEIGTENTERAEQRVFLDSIDVSWIHHLHQLDGLKADVRLRAYGQKDPLLEYKMEARDLFQDLLGKIEDRTVSLLFPEIVSGEWARAVRPVQILRTDYEANKPDIRPQPSGRMQPIGPAQPPPGRHPGPVEARPRPVGGRPRSKRHPVRVTAKVGRNDPCPCGSGKKFKKCCGR